MSKQEIASLRKAIRRLLESPQYGYRFVTGAREEAEALLQLGQPNPVHPEDVCQRCGGPNITWFVDNRLWNQYAGQVSILCPLCFAKAAEAAGYTPTAWQLVPENPPRTPVSDSQHLQHPPEGYPLVGKTDFNATGPLVQAKPPDDREFKDLHQSGGLGDRG